MPTIKSKTVLSQDAVTLATSFAYVRHNNVTYAPQDFETGVMDPIPPPERTVWVPQSAAALQRRAQAQFDTLFHTEADARSFEYMVAQTSQHETEISTSLLIRTEAGLRELKEDGKLHEPTGTFIPNALTPMLNEDKADKQFVLDTLIEWVGHEEEEAVALLRLLATSLAPGWSAVKYVLLMGDGRNGKSLLMEMLVRLYGRDNCSNVKRQEISDLSPVLFSLNGKLLNVVMDGQATYLKDSGHEKTLIAGEALSVRRLYSSELTPVQTNALFIEGLNREPKSHDKSTALQARIVRFWFPNVYDDDLEFRNRMLSERYVGALLALLLDNYVLKKDKAVMLAPTTKARELQLDHMHNNSLALQFVIYLNDSDPLGSDVLIDMDMHEVVSRFKSWRIKQNDLTTWEEVSVVELFRPVLVTERKGRRINGAPRKVRVVTAIKKETEELLALMKGDVDDTASVVED